MTDALFQKHTEHEIRILHLEKNQENLSDAVMSIKESLESLVRLEERHLESKEAINRAFGFAKEVDARVKSIELLVPGFVEVTDNVKRGVIAVVCLVGLAVLKFVIVG